MWVAVSRAARRRYGWIAVETVEWALVAGGIGLGVTFVVMPAVLLLLRRAQVVDVPGERSSHSEVTLRGAGLATCLACTAAGAVAAAGGGVGREGLLLGLVFVLAMLGLVDDVRTLDARVRLATQAVLAMVTVGVLVWVERGAPVAVLLGAAIVVWLVAYVNAFNFMDGINGISVAQVAAAASVWIGYGVAADDVLITVLAASSVGAAVGFLPYNLPTARAFLGDVGSYHFGASLAIGAAWLVWSGAPLEIALTPLGLYMADTSWTLVSRARAGQNLLEAHRSHAYQQLVDSGWSHPVTAGLVFAISAACGLLGVFASQQQWVARLAIDGVAIVLAFGYVALPAFLKRRSATEPDSATTSSAQAEPAQAGGR